MRNRGRGRRHGRGPRAKGDSRRTSGRFTSVTDGGSGIRATFVCSAPHDLKFGDLIGLSGEVVYGPVVGISVEAVLSPTEFWLSGIGFFGNSSGRWFLYTGNAP